MWAFLGGPPLWERIAVGVLITVAGGLLLAILIFLAARVRARLRGYRHARQEERLLRALLGLAEEHSPHDKLNVGVHKDTAAGRARLSDPGPVLGRLEGKRQVAPDPVYPNRWRLTFEGRRRARAQRPWWRGLLGE